MSNDRTRTAHTSVVGNVDDFTVGEMKMATVGERRVAVVRTPSGVHALDNACPHQGYGLTTGALDGELLTCQWHNWKFEASTGRCVMGEEDVASHAVDIGDDGDITVTVIEATAAEKKATLWPSLERAIDNAYVGQIARDALRLLDAGATPAAVMWAGFRPAIARAEYGPGHEMAMATDCLAIAAHGDPDGVALPVVQGIAALAEESRDRPERAVPSAAGGVDLADAIETERLDEVMAGIVRLLERGDSVDDVRRGFIDAVSQHHLGYGHGIIYTQKAFELLDLVGWDHARDVLPHLGVTITQATREDLLPYMRKAMPLIDGADTTELSRARRDPAWSVTGAMTDDLLDAHEAPIGLAIDIITGGGGVAGLLDALSTAASRRLLRHDLDVEFSTADHFHWLDVTHALTMTRAVRWAWTHEPGPATARLALFATWLLHDSGRAERRHGARAELEPVDTDRSITDAVLSRAPGETLGAVLALDRAEAGSQLLDSALQDTSGSFIVLAHLVKLTYAAIEEAETLDSPLPLLAAARYLSSPRRERFVARNVDEAVAFVKTGRPPRR